MTLNKPMGGNPGEICIDIASYLGCDCDYFPESDDYEPIYIAFDKAVIDGKANGYIPVLIVANDNLAEMFYSNAGVEFGNIDKDKLRNYREELINSISDDGAQDFFDEKLEEIQEYDDEYNFETELAGEIADGESLTGISIPFELGSNRTQELLLARIPVKDPWEVVAWLPMGNWNDCPAPESMISIAKKWYEKYGAVICSMSSDELEFRLEKPLADKNEAYALAKGHYFFCQDRLEQYAEDYNFGKLADCLMKSTVWYFWWD